MSSISTEPSQADSSPQEISIETLVEITCRIISQLEDGLQALSAEQYSTGIAEKTEKSSPIGGHVRHIVEFYQALIKKVFDENTSEISYDLRERNPLFESAKEPAIKELKSIRTRLDSIPSEDMTLSLRSVIDPNRPMFAMKTTLHRELVYLLDHTIHHMALIKMIANHQGVYFGTNFGLAQSTKAHEKQPSKS